MITTETRGRVTVVRMAHGKVNAFDPELMGSLIDRLEALEKADTAALVLTGTGGVFSAGVDLRGLTAGGPDYVKKLLPLLGGAFSKAFTFPKPVVAAVNGHAIAGGCVLACACDYRIMADGGGRIGTPELSVGVPFPSMALEILRLTVPAHRLQALIYRGLTCTPDEAVDNGLVDETGPSRGGPRPGGRDGRASRGAAAGVVRPHQAHHPRAEPGPRPRHAGGRRGGDRGVDVAPRAGGRPRLRGAHPGKVGIEEAVCRRPPGRVDRSGAEP